MDLKTLYNQRCFSGAFSLIFSRVDYCAPSSSSKNRSKYHSLNIK